MTRLSSGLPTRAVYSGIDAITGVVTGSSMYRVLGMTGLSSGLPTEAEVDVVTGVITGSSTGLTGLTGLTGFLSFEMSGSSGNRMLGVTGFVGLFVTGIVGALIDAIEVVMGVLSRGRGPAETPRSTGGPSLGDWSWWGIRVQCVLACDI